MSQEIFPHELIIAQQAIYEPCGLSIKNIVIAKESRDYGACSFDLNGRKVIFRVAHTTPIKIGQFVTIWKRQPQGPIAPYDIADNFDILVISVNSGAYRGQFVFPKQALDKHGFLSRGGKGGKRAMRVYPVWDKPLNKQARLTQIWQLAYFFAIDAAKPVDEIFIGRLFGSGV